MQETKLPLGAPTKTSVSSEQLLQGSAHAAAYLRALSHEFRILAVCHIGDGELSVQELEERLGASQSNVSQHLAKLKELGILTCRKVGNLSLYRIQDPAALELVNTLQKKFCTVQYK
jgi:ArsR family transcriptional regulator, virulence genes transcriptional regulator